MKMTTKISKTYLIVCSLAYHDRFILLAETMADAGFKAEKIVHDIADDAKVISIRESVDAIDWVEDENT